MKDEKEVVPDVEEDCFGEYGRFKFCRGCALEEKCKRFTNAERNISIRGKGKYSSRGKERGRDRY